MAERFQIKRWVRGWRKPADGVLLVRPHSPWANPYKVKDYGRDEALRLYRLHLMLRTDLVERARAELAGKPLGCWCPLDQPCHVDILVEMAWGGGRRD